MKLKLFFTLIICIFTCSISYALTCESTLTDLYFWQASIKKDRVVCRYRGMNKDHTGSAYNMYDIYGSYAPLSGTWKIGGREHEELQCLAAEDGNSFECQFKLKN